MSDRLQRLLAPTATTDNQRRAALAAAALLIELAGSDDNTTSVELALVRDTLSKHFKLDDDDIEELMAATRDVSDPDEHARYIRTNFSQGEKWKVADAMKAIIWSDGEVHEHEAKLSATMANALGLPLAELQRILTP